MSFNVHPEELENTELKAIAIFAPFLLKEALQRQCHSHSASCLDEFERAMVDRIDEMESEQPNFAAMKGLAISNLYVMLKSVRDHPHTKQPMEDLKNRRTQGRSEHTETLEEQLQSGLEDSFPASDPPAVVSTAISGGSPKLVGVEETLRRKRAAQTTGS